MNHDSMLTLYAVGFIVAAVLGYLAGKYDWKVPSIF